MKNKITAMVFLLCAAVSLAYGQDRTTVEALSDDIADNLDLKSIASMFGEATDLEHFEFLINDPEKGVSNLDLNGDGYVDYLRVVETGVEETRLVAIQAVIGEDKYQDVATVEVEKDEVGKTYVQVVGDVHMYGPNYIIEPVYVIHPPIIIWMWRPRPAWYYSTWYWSHYPVWYNPWNPYPLYIYQDHWTVYMNYQNSYHFVPVRRSVRAPILHQQIHRNDYASNHPKRAFVVRNKNAKNYSDLGDRSRPVDQQVVDPGNKNPGKKVDENWKPKSEVTKSGDLKADPNVKSEGQDKTNATVKPDGTNKTNTTVKPDGAGKTEPEIKNDGTAKPDQNKNVQPSKERVPQKEVAPRVETKEQKPTTTKERNKTSKSKAKKATPERKMVPRNSNTIRKPRTN